MRRMIYVKTAKFEGWKCNQCGWEFKPANVMSEGGTLDDWKRAFEDERNWEFKAHVCDQK